jgi:hypothetical protein
LDSEHGVPLFRRSGERDDRRLFETPETLLLNGRACDEFRICGVVGNSVDRSGFEVFCMSLFISPLFGIVVVLAIPEMRPERIEQA